MNPPAPPRLLQRLRPDLLFLASGLFVLATGYGLAWRLTIPRCTGHRFGYDHWLSNWDGQWYQYIAQHGYHYSDAGGFGPQVFFPLYPMLGRLLDRLTPLHGQLPLLLVSWAAAWAFCHVWLRYAAARLPAGSAGAAPLWGLALVLLWPVGYFLRAAYTEALYLLLLTALFLGLARRWQPATLVLLTGLLTATRPTAPLFCIVLTLHLFVRFDDMAWPKRTASSLGLGLLSGWGLYAYMAYLALDFGQPLMFATKQAAWNYGLPADVFVQRWREMASLEPAWGFLVDGSLRDPYTWPWNLQNRGSFLLALGLVAVGAARRWLSWEELLFCLLTLALLYVVNAPKGMQAVGRYLSTLVPLYLVGMRLLMLMPRPARIGVLALCAAGLAVQTAHFRLWACVY